MQSKFEDLLRTAEDHYLQPTEMNQFKQQVGALQDRLTLYEALRDQELTIFQVVAHQLQKEASNIPQATLEQMLTRWISVLRYAAMAMLMNQPDYLENQLKFYAEILRRDDLNAINHNICLFLKQCLRSILNEEQLVLLEPFIQRIDTHLVSIDKNRELVVMA